MGAVPTVDVQGRICLGIALFLGLCQGFGKTRALGTHLRQDVITGTIDNPVDRLNGIGSQPGAQGRHNRNAPGTARLKGNAAGLLIRHGI